ncbi:cysteine desulfurase, SufS subfamily [Thermaerobacter marianensis DSM 12885]|uniref:Cysteine desulfurase n=1 Tax=Thermaerobacter marianensis (strain ATCC 700841 / DSM 12885 / JCM 10246 / 7p75a) TaxID=644966 RepID=E6SL37_THEM7|nr:cysteine desulfurase [Thermaerobacter marianensis]ADU50239.1 cysteine desulfurase, SufS subfamily [Thermaerobacter marianensis DSM 12885]
MAIPGRPSAGAPVPAPGAGTSPASFDPAVIRRDFPILQRQVHGRPLAYLDSAATSQKPGAVIDALAEFYRQSNANVHRGIHTLAEEATAAYEGARARTAAFLGAREDEIVFTRGATEALNLVAWGWALHRLRPGDTILVTLMEHHSNLVPWQQVAARGGFHLRAVPLTGDGRLDRDAFTRLLEEHRPKVVALAHMSNVLGTINPVAELARQARQAGAVVVVDGAQSVPHLPVDVAELGVDFLAFSAHKMLGPTGLGVLYGRRERLAEMEPLLGGGGMIRQVEVERSTWADPPHRFEAGTPPIAEAAAFTAALDYLERLGMEAVAAHERELVRYAWERLREIPGLTIYGPAPEHRGGVISFTVEGVHPHDLAQVLDGEGVAIRAGHHCTQPLHRHLGVVATARASFYIYNDRDDVDRLVAALHHARRLLAGS